MGFSAGVSFSLSAFVFVGMFVFMLMLVAVFVTMMVKFGVTGETILVRNWIFEEDGFWWEKGESEIHDEFDCEQECGHDYTESWSDIQGEEVEENKLGANYSDYETDNIDDQNGAFGKGGLCVEKERN